MDIDQNWIAERLTILVPLWLSLSVHEFSHGWAAWRLGDDTAKHMGRLTLNPLAHIDPVGTLLLPLLGIPFGWAKPVPVQPHRFRPDVSMKKGMMLTAAAGPISNLILASASIVLFALLVRFRPFGDDVDQSAARLLTMMILLNVLLAVFNALPIPPLDGSRMVDALVPDFLRSTWEAFCRLGPFALGAVIILPMVMHVNLFYWPFHITTLVIDYVVKLVGG